MQVLWRYPEGPLQREPTPLSTLSAECILMLTPDWQSFVALCRILYTERGFKLKVLC